MSKRILFVDDEPMVLRGIARSLRSVRNDWHLEFLPGGPEALEAMERQPFDVVVTDMRMPGMDGAQLLEQLKNRFPSTVRMALSGQSDRATLLRAVGPTHQYLSKPCDAEELKQKIHHALALRDLLDNPTLKEAVSRLEVVPCLPSLHATLSHLLESPNCSITEANAVIVRDLGMTAKLLQLVNSAFLGTPSPVASASKAAALMGIDTLRTLILSLRLFVPLETGLNEELTEVWEHGFATGTYAQAIAECQSCEPHVVEAAFTAGLLHDIGKLVLAWACSDEYEFALRSKAEKNISTTESEFEVFASTHAQVGAYLLGLWGLPDSIVDAVAWHHEPAQAKPVNFSPLIAVHVASILDNRRQPAASAVENEVLDEHLLVDLGLKEQLAVWVRRCEQLNPSGANHG
jgi:putative nucleotidyltransferase with HDIG domain